MVNSGDNWLKKASQPRLSFDIDGKQVVLSLDQFEQVCKENLKKSVAIQRIFDRFGVNIDRLDDLRIVASPLEQKYAETDSEEMRINQNLVKNSNFFSEYFFVLAHEIVHWLTRIKEEEAYFNDPEETLGFISSVAYELEKTKDLDSVWNKIYNRISWHFHDENDARKFFENMVIKAKELLQ